MIKNIIFDIGNVILEGKSSDSLNHTNLSEEDKYLIKKILFNPIKYIDLDYGLLDYRSYFDKYNHLLPERLHKEAYYCLTNSCKLRNMNNDIISLISKLHKKYKIYILSNNNKDVINYLKTTILNNYIDGWIVSCDYRTIKPYPKIYNILLKKYNLKPEECYFIDDKEENVITSINLGMNGYILDWQTNTFDDLLVDMENNQIEVK